MSAGALPPNPRVQRTRSSPSARHSPLTRHPLGGRAGAMRAPSHALLPRAFPSWQGAWVDNDSSERGASCGVSIYGAVVAPGETPSWA